ncbi:MAG: uroporphyrinogen-III synthase [Bryobacterales bacterium]|nr:uroporphyrinogen-III synthase [Bryobacterales bacterium]
MSLESRRAKEMEALIVRHGGDAFVAPSVREKAVDAGDALYAWVERLLAGEFDCTVFMTGAGLSYLRDAVLTRYPKERFVEALRKTTIVARGPKPTVVLHELGLKVQVQIPEPNTWREVVPILAGRGERRIAIQEYGRDNHEFVAALEAIGAEVSPVSIYKWELPEDTGPIREAARRIAGRCCDVVVFTTSIQLVHLLQIAAEMGLEERVRSALRDDLVIASVGPIMDAALREHGFEPDVIPAHPKMGILLRAAAEESHAALARKRGRVATPTTP